MSFSPRTLQPIPWQVASTRRWERLLNHNCLSALSPVTSVELVSQDLIYSKNVRRRTHKSISLQKGCSDIRTDQAPPGFRAHMQQTRCRPILAAMELAFESQLALRCAWARFVC